VIFFDEICNGYCWKVFLLVFGFLLYVWLTGVV